jgi:hypothetical protein
MAALSSRHVLPQHPARVQGLVLQVSGESKQTLRRLAELGHLAGTLFVRALRGCNAGLRLSERIEGG